MPIIGKHHTSLFERLGSHGRLRGEPQGEDEATVLLINTYRTPVSGVFRRKEFWFRGLWRKPGQRFAVCGVNLAWQQWRRRERHYAAELVALPANVVLAHANAAVATSHRGFPIASDSVGS